MCLYTTLWNMKITIIADDFNGMSETESSKFILPAVQCYRGAIIILEAAWRYRLACVGEAACMTDDDRHQRAENNTGSLHYL